MRHGCQIFFDRGYNPPLIYSTFKKKSFGFRSKFFYLCVSVLNWGIATITSRCFFLWNRIFFAIVGKMNVIKLIGVPLYNVFYCSQSRVSVVLPRTPFSQKTKGAIYNTIFWESGYCSVYVTLHILCYLHKMQPVVSLHKAAKSILL